MKIGICDDIREEREQAKRYCQKLGYNDIALFSSGEELLNCTDLSMLNLLFLDIEMEGISGIDVKNKLEQTNPSTFIVFCTTHQELMPNAFGRNVISFLTKPFDQRPIEQCIKKAAFLSKEFYPISIDEKTAIPCKDILYLHAEQKYTIFYITNGKTFTTRKSLKNWAEELEALGFCPISRAAVINLKHYIKTNNKQVFLYNDIVLPISRRYLQILEKKFDEYILHMMKFE